GATWLGLALNATEGIDHPERLWAQAAQSVSSVFLRGTASSMLLMARFTDGDLVSTNENFASGPDHRT
ncbi:MAG: hypothetical protein ABJD68_07495, partial [Nakamurella sp.]